jgi:hypothetical protein
LLVGWARQRARPSPLPADESGPPSGATAWWGVAPGWPSPCGATAWWGVAPGWPSPCGATAWPGGAFELPAGASGSPVGARGPVVVSGWRSPVGARGPPDAPAGPHRSGSRDPIVRARVSSLIAAIPSSFGCLRG